MSLSNVYSMHMFTVCMVCETLCNLSCFMTCHWKVNKLAEYTSEETHNWEVPLE